MTIDSLGAVKVVLVIKPGHLVQHLLQIANGRNSFRIAIRKYIRNLSMSKQFQ